MEALTIRQLYDRKIREDGDKLYKKELRRHQKTESRLQEEAKMRQEAESGLMSIALQLHKQGTSVEKIAEMMAKPVEFVQKFINSAKKS